MTIPFSMTLQVTGSNVTQIDDKYTFTLNTKQEQLIELQASTGDVLLSFTNVKNPYLLIAKSVNAFTLKLNKNAETISIPSNGDVPIILPLTQAFMTSIDSFEITTANTNLIDVEIQVYGKEVPVV